MVCRVVFNQKGGVGKSTITVNLAAAAAIAGRSVLVVDLDPQANTSRYLLGEVLAQATPTLTEFFEQTLNFSLYAHVMDDFVHATPCQGLFLLPAGDSLAEQQSKLEARYKIYKLRESLQEFGGRFDEIWLDTPPALNFFTLSALIAADRCLIPFDCDAFSREALVGLLGRVAEIKADHNPRLEVEGIIVNQFQARASLPTRMVEELAAQGLPVLQPYLSSSVKIRESHERAMPLVQLDPRHKLAQAFSELYQSLAK
ncbi:ParA family protein [Silvimonas sp.]|uniref:ParA family protein n=1 Tax=Silvimonas sp. TaxID=2650811 RepID=UPI0028456667|nr:ParA family protein [Silvimonas sp.]MDR3427374.1 ParA family protein [Silvimonas sp.]